MATVMVKTYYEASIVAQFNGCGKSARSLAKVTRMCYNAGIFPAPAALVGWSDRTYTDGTRRDEKHE
jgi:hypothetical protein